jgi:ubiquinone/menaquinone biosynthesis C-methylase UbiE
MLTLCEPCPGATILDLGCGDGKVAVQVSQKVGAGKTIGIDVVPENIAAARANGIIGIEADLNVGVPLADESVDMIVASQIIEHVYDTDLFVKECFRVLRRGGVHGDSHPEPGSAICHILPSAR